MKKTMIFVIVCITTMMMIVGCACGKQEQPTPTSITNATSAVATPMPSSSATPVLINTPTPEPRVTPGAKETVNYKDKETIAVEYYDADSQRTVTKEYQTDGKNSADAAFQAVNEVFLKDLLGSKGITVNSVLFSDGNLFIDFPKKIYELNLGSAGESSFLESIADTYLNNVEGIKAVYYTVDKEAYASENIELLKDTPYKKK